ncbi:CopG family transcriptional regulator [bacterium]|nr:MAG: CopG family transcriptional regulator [bacterium]
MRKQSITIYISSKLIERIDNEAKQQNRSRSNLIETKLEHTTKTVEPYPSKTRTF